MTLGLELYLSHFLYWPWWWVQFIYSTLDGAISLRLCWHAVELHVLAFGVAGRSLLQSTDLAQFVARVELVLGWVAFGLHWETVLHTLRIQTSSFPCGIEFKITIYTSIASVEVVKSDEGNRLRCIVGDGLTTCQNCLVLHGYKMKISLFFRASRHLPIDLNLPWKSIGSCLLWLWAWFAHWRGATGWITVLTPSTKVAIILRHAGQAVTAAAHRRACARPSQTAVITFHLNHNN